MYELLAWLPGEPKFIAKQGDQFGFLIRGEFQPMRGGRNILDAATSKYFYELLPQPIMTNGGAELDGILGTLMASLKPQEG